MASEEKLDIRDRTNWEFIIHVLAGSVIFIVIMLIATVMHFLRNYMLQINEAAVFFPQVLLILEYIVFITDVLLFIYFLLSITVSFLKKVFELRKGTQDEICI